MKQSSRAGSSGWALVTAILATGALWIAPALAWADVCFGGGSHPRELKDAGSSDGSTVGLRQDSGGRRQVGTGLVLVAGLGGAWLGSRRKADGGGDDGAGPLK
ncbi:MAG TPA: hypothetical protein VMT03_00575 [Polyangia bacterium]|nr:hypothetical protein [Polyangia bacterium]